VKIKFKIVAVVKSSTHDLVVHSWPFYLDSQSGSRVLNSLVKHAIANRMPYVTASQGRNQTSFQEEATLPYLLPSPSFSLLRPPVPPSTLLPFPFPPLSLHPLPLEVGPLKSS